MNNYEILFIIKPELNEEGLKNATKAIADSVTKNGGTIKKEENWGKKPPPGPGKIRRASSVKWGDTPHA